MSYESQDAYGGVLPTKLHEEAIAFARKTTGFNRPHQSHSVLIDAFRECFKAMQKLGMVTEEYKYVRSDQTGLRQEDVLKRRD